MHLADDLVLLSVHNKVTKALATEPKLQGLRNIEYRNPQVFGFLPVDIDIEFGLVELQVHVYKAEGRVFADFLHEAGQGFFQFGKIGRLQNKLYR